MAFCSNCGSRMIEGAAFCPECGTKNLLAGASSLQASAPSSVPPPSQAHTAYQPQPQTPPQQAQKTSVQYGAIKFEMVEKETLKFLKVDFENSAVRYESGGMYYMQG